jgi:hypothetical protein
MNLFFADISLLIGITRKHRALRYVFQDFVSLQQFSHLILYSSVISGGRSRSGKFQVGCTKTAREPKVLTARTEYCGGS